MWCYVHSCRSAFGVFRCSFRFGPSLFLLLLCLLGLNGPHRPSFMPRLSSRQHRDHHYLLFCCALFVHFICYVWPISLPQRPPVAPQAPFPWRAMPLGPNNSIVTQKTHHSHPLPSPTHYYWHSMLLIVLTYFAMRHILCLLACFVCLPACFGPFPLCTCPSLNPEQLCLCYCHCVDFW